MADIHVGDTPKIRECLIEDNAAVDISGATTKQFIIKKPNGTLLTKTSDFSSDGTDGRHEYQFADSEIDASGVWKVQSNFEGVGGWDGRGQIKSFYVRDVLA